MSRLTFRVSVVNAVRAPVRARVWRSFVVAAAGVPEVAARVPAGAALTLRITGDRELRRLNRAFLGVDAVTDVLSFPAGADVAEPAYLGDIALSWPAVVRQAAEHGHPAAAEAALLSVHGLLHLLGWDHATAAEEREMWRLTRAGLAAAGVSELSPGRL